jgi:hypothetical protein
MPTTERRNFPMPKYRRGYMRGKTAWIGYYDPKTGKQVCESTKQGDKAEARRLLRQRLGELAEGRYVGPSAERVTFDDLATGL